MLDEFSGSNCRCNEKCGVSLLDISYFTEDRPKDILDSDLSVHFWEIDALYDEFWNTLTFDKAKIMLQILMANGGATPVQMEKLIIRSDHVCKKWQELFSKQEKLNET